jgi:hypothetical protein
MLVQQFFNFLATKRTVLLFTSLFFGAAGFGTLCEILDIDFEIVALALGIGLTITSYVSTCKLENGLTSTNELVSALEIRLAPKIYNKIR